MGARLPGRAGRRAARAPTTCRGRATRRTVLRRDRGVPRRGCATSRRAEPDPHDRAGRRRARGRARRAALGGRALPRAAARRAAPAACARASTAPPAPSAARRALAELAAASCAPGVHTGECELRDGRAQPARRWRSPPASPRAARAGRDPRHLDRAATSSPARASSSPSAAPVELPLAGASREWRCSPWSGELPAVYPARIPRPQPALRAPATGPWRRCISTDPQRGRHRSSCSARSTPSGAARARARSRSAPRNRWINGAHNRSTIQGFYGAGREDDARARGVRGRRRRAGDPARHRHRARTRPSTCCTRSPRA